MSIENISATLSAFPGYTSNTKQTKTTFQKVLFSDLIIDVLPTGKAKDKSFKPDALRQAIYFWTISDTGVTKPSFLTNEEWNSIKQLPSGFISGAGTLMPKIIFPSQEVTANGLDCGNDSWKVPYDKYKKTFNWTINKELSDTSLVNLNKNERFGIKHTGNEQQFTFINMGFTAKCSLDDDGIKKRVYDLKVSDSDSVTSSNFTTPLIGKGQGGAACAVVIAFDSTSPVTSSTVSSSPAPVLPKAQICLGNSNTISVESGGNITVAIDEQITCGNLVRAENALVPGHAKLMKNKAVTYLAYPVWNGICVASGIQDSRNIVEIANLYAKKNVNVNMQDFCDPKFDEYPLDDPEDVEVKYETSVKTDWGDFVRIKWENAVGSFAYVPAFFCPKCKFSVFFRDRTSEGIDGEDATNTYSYKAYNVFSYNSSNYIIQTSQEEAEQVANSDQGDGTAYFRLDFEIVPENEGDNSVWQRRGLETWGFIKATTETQNTPRIENKNGTFSMSSSGGAVTLGSYYKYISDININLGMENCTGTINFDKYAMIGQNTAVSQSIGGIKIVMDGGNSEVIKTSNDPIFSGIAMELQESMSADSDSISVALYGLERKLEDIKLINAPFWDGDDVGDVADWIGSYAGIEIDFSHGDRSKSLPRSVDFEKPAVNFVMGTSALEALQKIANYTNHLFVIQADGKGYFYEMNFYGIPKHAFSSTIHNFTSKEVISVNKQPEYANMYNAYLTVGLITAGGQATINDKKSPLQTDVMPYILFDKKSTTPNYPWSRLAVSGEQGYLSVSKLTELHKNNMKAGSHYMMQGSITIPGNSSIKLFDRINITDSGTSDTLYVHNISHSINFQSDEWTTSLSVAVTVGSS